MVCLIVPDALPALNVILPVPLAIFSLKVIAIFELIATPVAPSAGLKDDVEIGTVVKSYVLITLLPLLKLVSLNAPSSTEVSANWYSRNNAVTSANAQAACGDWFVPSYGQLQNPGYVCRTYWDSYSNAKYWSDTQCNSVLAYYVHFSNGNATWHMKNHAFKVRAFRTVSY